MHFSSSPQILKYEKVGNNRILLLFRRTFVLAVFYHYQERCLIFSIALSAQPHLWHGDTNASKVTAFSIQDKIKLFWGLTEEWNTPCFSYSLEDIKKTFDGHQNRIRVSLITRIALNTCWAINSTHSSSRPLSTCAWMKWESRHVVISLPRKWYNLWLSRAFKIHIIK